MSRVFILLILLLAFSTAFISLCIGSITLSPIQVVEVLLGNSSGEGTGNLRSIIIGIRFPRILAGVFVGASLALSGLLIQSLTRNPLADPYLLGISSGALLGSGLAVLFHGFLHFIPYPYLLLFSSLLGGLFAFILTLILSEACGGTVFSLILAGLAVSTGLSGASVILSYIIQLRYGTVIHWLMGSLSSITWRDSLMLALIFIPLALVAELLWKRFDAILLGEDHSMILGYSPVRTRRIIMVLSAVLTSLTVSIAGIIGFIGLIVPHMARGIIGCRHKELIPAVILLGSTMMVASDTLARSILLPGWPGEMPVGAVTSFFGAPIFAYLIIRVSRRG